MVDGQSADQTPGALVRLVPASNVLGTKQGSTEQGRRDAQLAQVPRCHSTVKIQHRVLRAEVFCHVTRKEAMAVIRVDGWLS